MKYRLLTKEQFTSLHQEFATFLAVQEIDKNEWDMIKIHQPEKVDAFLQQFSDLVWEDVLNKTQYLEHVSKDSLNLFFCGEKTMERIVVRIEKTGINLLDQDDFNWFLDNSNSKDIQYFKGKKEYRQSRNLELFKLIEEGCSLSDGKIFRAIAQVLG